MIQGLDAKQRGSSKPNVYNTIKDAIQFLEIKPGSQISDVELSTMLGVSRTPIREALVRLSDEMLVDIYPQRGTYVSKIDIALSKEMAYMRHVIETEIMSDLCERKVDLQDHVEDKLYLMNLALKRKDTLEYIRQDSAFHRSIFEYANHELIWDIISNTRVHYVRMLVLDMGLPKSLKKSYESHKAIVKCIKSGEKEQLLQILDEHHDYKVTDEDRELLRKYPEYFKKDPEL